MSSQPKQSEFRRSYWQNFQLLTLTCSQLPCLYSWKSNHILAFTKKNSPDRTQSSNSAIRKTPSVSSCLANWSVHAAAADKHCLLVLPYRLLRPLSGIVVTVDDGLLQPSPLVQGDRCPRKCRGQPELGQKSHADPEVEGCRMNRWAN